MEAILDSNFIISCIKRNIDFIDSIEGLGFKAIIPREIIQEMKDLRLRVNHEEKAAIDLAFQIFEKSKIRKMTLSKKKVDDGLIELGRKGAYIATLDSGIRRLVPNTIVIDNAKNSIAVERK